MLSGLIPTVIPKSPRVLMIFNLVGAGLLFGVAVGVIIPEAIAFIYVSTLPGYSEGGNNNSGALIHDFDEIGTLSPLTL